MTQALTRSSNPYRSNADQFVASELKEPTLQSADDWYEIFSVQGDTTTAYGAGYGPNNDSINTDGWSDLDLQNAAGNPIDGKLRFRVYRDSSKDDLIAQSTTYTLSGLRSAVSADRKDKHLISQMHSKLAGNDSFVTVEVKPKASSAGDQVSAADSATDLGLAYAEVPL